VQFELPDALPVFLVDALGRDAVGRLVAGVELPEKGVGVEVGGLVAADRPEAAVSVRVVIARRGTGAGESDGGASGRPRPPSTARRETPPSPAMAATSRSVSESVSAAASDRLPVTTGRLPVVRALCSRSSRAIVRINASVD